MKSARNRYSVDWIEDVFEVEKNHDCQEMVYGTFQVADEEYKSSRYNLDLEEIHPAAHGCYSRKSVLSKSDRILEVDKHTLTLHGLLKI